MDKPGRLICRDLDADCRAKSAHSSNYPWFGAGSWYRRTGAVIIFLFALIGGSVADRVDKRRFLLITQSLSMGLAFLLGILITPFRNVTLYDKRNLIRQEFGNCPETVASILESGGL